MKVQLTFSKTVLLFLPRLMRLRKLYETGGAYRATILPETSTMETDEQLLEKRWQTINPSHDNLIDKKKLTSRS